MAVILDKRLNDHGKNWRHVYKSLIVLEHLICCGSERALHYVMERLYMVETLRLFQHIDANYIDQGANVRNKSREIVDLLGNEQAVATARATRSIPRVPSRNPDPLTLSNSRSTDAMPRSGSGGALGRSPNPPARNSYDDLQHMTEEEALAFALRESQELYEQREKNRSRSLDPSLVYPNFLDNVSKASLARSSHSGDLIEAPSARPAPAAIAAPSAAQAPALAPKNVFGDLLGMSNDEFEQALDSSYEKKQRSQSDGHLLALGSLYQPAAPAASANPFVAVENHVAFQPEVDPFGDVASTDPFGTQQQHAAREAVPMPVAPGLAPVNHMAVGANNVGAKPVMPHQMAPQFSQTMPHNTPQHSHRDGGFQ